MSTLRVEVVRPDAILDHPNADRLEIAHVKGWQCVVPKGEFKTTDDCVYFPIDSILPEQVESKLFSPDAKIKLSNHRIKTIKIRGVISQGLLVKLDELRELIGRGPAPFGYEIGDDLGPGLGVTKYEPPVESTPQAAGEQTSHKQTNPHFRKYTDIENFKNFPNLFQEYESVWVLEKIHGTNFRAGYVPTYVNTWWKKVKKFFGLLPEYEFVYGSHNVQLQDSKYQNKFINKNVYLEAVEKYDLRNKLKPGEVIYGEIYGKDIQKGFMYDCKPNERKLAVFDVMIDGKYLSHGGVEDFCICTLPCVPGKLMAFDKEKIQVLVDMPSWLNGGLREGVVIKPLLEEQAYMGRKILKWKNNKFLLKCEDDTH